MTPESQNEAVVRRFYDEMWNEWQLGVADEILSEEIHFRGSLGTVCEGREAFRNYVEGVRAAFPDWHNRIDEILAAPGARPDRGRLGSRRHPGAVAPDRGRGSGLVYANRLTGRR